MHFNRRHTCPVLPRVNQYILAPRRVRPLLREQYRDSDSAGENTTDATTPVENLPVDAVMAGGVQDNGFGEDGDHTPACPADVIDHAEAWEYYMGMAG